MTLPFQTGEPDTAEKEYIKSGETDQPLTEGEIDRQREEAFEEGQKESEGAEGEEENESEDTEGDTEGENEEGNESEGEDEGAEEDEHEDDEAEGEGDDEKVSLSLKKALAKERKRAKEQRTEKERLFAENRVLRERAENILDRLTSFTPKKEEVNETEEDDDGELPSYEEDPAKYLSAKVERLERQLAKRDAKDAQTAESQQQASQVNVLSQRFNMSEADYAQSAPGYGEAIRYLRDQRMQDFADMGLTSEQAGQAWNGEVLSIANQAFEKGTNPAETLHKRAIRMGFKEKDLKGKEKVATIKKGQKKSSRMAGGDAPKTGKMTVNDLLELDDEEFLKAFDKMGATGNLG